MFLHILQSHLYECIDKPKQHFTLKFSISTTNERLSGLNFFDESSPQSNDMKQEHNDKTFSTSAWACHLTNKARHCRECSVRADDAADLRKQQSQLCNVTNKTRQKTKPQQRTSGFLFSHIPLRNHIHTEDFWRHRKYIWDGLRSSIQVVLPSHWIKLWWSKLKCVGCTSFQCHIYFGGRHISFHLTSFYHIQNNFFEAIVTKRKRPPRFNKQWTESYFNPNLMIELMSYDWLIVSGTITWEAENWFKLWDNDCQKIRFRDLKIFWLLIEISTPLHLHCVSETYLRIVQTQGLIAISI